MSKQDRKKRVLIVDDEEDMIWSLQKNLPNESLQVIIFIASSGEEALSILEKKKIDLIVTDIRMPGISGIDLLITVRNKYPDIGVIVMTAFPSTESKAEVMEKGGLRFIEKPFDIKEMRDSVQSALKMDSHFEGKMTGIQLTDIIQINNLSQASTALRVNTDGREGVIYFFEGSIVHATCDDLVGEDAFYKLIRFKGGTIETFYPDTFPESTINTPVGVLLLKGTLLADEMDENGDFLKELDQEQQPALETVVEDEPPAAIYEPELESSDPVIDDVYPAEMNNLEVEEGMNELKELLTEFTNIPGANTACLVGRDGFLLESVALSGIDAEMIGAIASSGFGASEAMGNQLQKGGMSMTMVEYENGPVMFSPVGTEAFLVIIADKDANLGMIRLKIKKHSKDIEHKAGI